jgi:hypothetical protein
MDPISTEPPSLLAAQARTLVLRGCRSAAGGDHDSPAELYRTIGALRLLTEDVAQVLPELLERLEDGLISGRVTRVASVDPATEALAAVSEVALALSHARSAGLLMAKELETAQAALRDLAAS